MTSTIKLPARSLVVAPRLPDAPRFHTGDPFTAEGYIVIDCDQPACGWHCMVERSLGRKAIEEHRRQYHGSAFEPLVIRLNNPRH